MIGRVVTSLHDRALDHSNSSHEKCPSCDLSLIRKQAEGTEASVCPIFDLLNGINNFRGSFALEMPHTI
jgi:hypothetical protein